MLDQETELKEKEDRFSDLSKNQLRRLVPLVIRYSHALGAPVPAKKNKHNWTFPQLLVRICKQFSDINAKVRDEGGKVTLEQCARFLHLMVHHPIGNVSISYDDIDALRYKRKKQARKLGLGRGPADDLKKAFYRSWDWNNLRFQTLLRFGRRCMCCGATPETGATLQVDHIKPIHTHWPLRLDPENLQVLCASCNRGKGATSEADFRPDQPIGPEP